MGSEEGGVQPGEARCGFRRCRRDFFDELAITIADKGEEEEERWVTIGADVLSRVLVVVYTWRADVIRLISACKATRRERKQYEEDR